MNSGVSKSDLELIKNEIIKNLGQTKNPKIYLYGSRAKGNFRPYSDIDLLLIADQYDEQSLSQADFEQLDIPYKVDFVLDKDLFAAYRDEIHEHMVEL